MLAVTVRYINDLRISVTVRKYYKFYKYITTD